MASKCYLKWVVQDPKIFSEMVKSPFAWQSSHTVMPGSEVYH